MHLRKLTAISWAKPTAIPRCLVRGARCTIVNNRSLAGCISCCRKRAASELGRWMKQENYSGMTAEKNKDELFTKVVAVRLTKSMHARYNAICKETNCRSLGELVRRMLERQRIVWHHRDATMDKVADELAAIRNELRYIGVNINQSTHYLHSTDVPVQKIRYAQQIAGEYKKVTVKVEQLLMVITNVQKKWSSKS